MTMDAKTREKIAVLGVSFALFLGGVGTLSLERGAVRTTLLAVCMAGLLGIAVLQSVRNIRKKGK